MSCTSPNDNNNEDNLSVSNWVDKLSLSDISVGEILDIYKNDTDLLKHILAAKTEEDKRKGAEEIRRAEEARLHSKFIDLQLEQNRRSSFISDNNSTTNNSDWNNELLSSILNNEDTSNSNTKNTPPSPISQLQLQLSPYTLFEVPFANLNLSAPSSPEPAQPPQILIDKISLVDDNSGTSIMTETTNTNNDILNIKIPPTPPTINIENTKERASIKRTLSRTRSTRKPSIKALSKKNRSSLIQQSKQEMIELEQQQQQLQQHQQLQKELPLDHDKVMEALRAKLQRSTQQQKELKENPPPEITSMSPSGILLLDLKNPKKSFPVRQKATPRASVVRKPNSFISAHKPKE